MYVLTLISFGCFLVLSSITANEEHPPFGEYFSTEENTRMKLYKDMMLANWDYEAFADCVKSSQVKRELLQYIIIHYFLADDQNLKDFLLCYGLKKELINENKTINYQVVYNFLNAFDCGNERENRRTIGFCRKKEGSGPDSLYQTLKCVMIRLRRYIHKPKWWLVYDTYFGYSYYY